MSKQLGAVWSNAALGGRNFWLKTFMKRQVYDLELKQGMLALDGTFREDMLKRGLCRKTRLRQAGRGSATLYAHLP